MKTVSRQPAFSTKRWRASRDLRIDIAYVVAAIALLAAVSALDRVTPAGAAPAAQQAPPTAR